MGRPPMGNRKQVNVRLPVDLVAKIDEARGFTSRDVWFEKAATLALKPVNQALVPELLQRVHYHDYATPVSTQFRQGRKYRTYRCECGDEEEQLA